MAHALELSFGDLRYRSFTLRRCEWLVTPRRSHDRAATLLQIGCPFQTCSGGQSPGAGDPPRLSQRMTCMALRSLGGMLHLMIFTPRQLLLLALWPAEDAVCAQTLRQNWVELDH